ncbi:MAG: transposase family protein [Proteobacteria bacterium]|nr:transposase family protein [Pseudomonadota bacterium]
MENFTGIALWFEAKPHRLREFITLEHGIPSYDAMGCVFCMIAPGKFESAGERWVGMEVPTLAGETVIARLALRDYSISTDTAIGSQSGITPRRSSMRKPTTC